MGERTPLEALEEITKIQCNDGNWNFDPYMHGMANGMILALATVKDEEPEYLEAPKKWGCYTPSTDLALGESNS